MQAGEKRWLKEVENAVVDIRTMDSGDDVNLALLTLHANVVWRMASKAMDRDLSVG